MRIAICGAHGVWKTTISKQLAEYFKLPILKDIVVDAHHLWFVINETTPLETQVRLTGKQLEQEKIYDKFIADKCVFDYHVYAKALSMDINIINVTKMVAIDTYKYDHIFYIKPEFPIEDDWLRSTNIEFQSAVDSVYESFLLENAMSFHYLTGTVLDRFNKAREIIENTNAFVNLNTSK